MCNLLNHATEGSVSCACYLYIMLALGELIYQIMAHVRADNLIIKAELHRQCKDAIALHVWLYHCNKWYG